MPYDASKNLKENIKALAEESDAWQKYLLGAAEDYDRVPEPTQPQKLARARLKYMAANISLTARSAKEEVEGR